MKRPTAIVGSLTAAVVLLISGCGGSDQSSTPESTVVNETGPANTERPEPAVDVGRNQEAGSSPERATGRNEEARQIELERAAAAAESAYSEYIEAINARDGEALCRLLPADALRTLRPPVDEGTCEATLAASIGYRDPRGYPVWEQTTLTEVESSSVAPDLAAARLTAAIVTDFADRSEPSVESDIAYLELIAGRWRLAKPSSAIYRAIGRPEPPPDVISPPAAAPPPAPPQSTLVAYRASTKPTAFEGRVDHLSPRLRQRMTGVSWHQGCPVGLGRLRLVRATYLDFHGRPRQGRLVVHERYADGMLDVLQRVFAKRFPIRRMELIDRYGADDHRSMHHDNTSAFNCRFVNGTDRWSMHAYGKAIDINPRENPYVSGDFVSPPEGRPYADRSPKRKGMIYRNGTVANSMKRIIGWQWAGNWSGARDYQHFSHNGR